MSVRLSDESVMDLLTRIDNGYKPTKEEKADLELIQSLDLHRDVSELPNSVSLLTSLERLSIYDTTVSVLPESLGNLKTLKRLTFFRTYITQLPHSIGNLTFLKSLDFENTAIEELPESLGDMTSLESLNLHGTSIRSLPNSIGKLPSLKTLDLRGSSIVGIPESIGDLKTLERLDLCSTPICSLPNSITKLSSLKALYLTNSSINELPESIGNLTHLESLEMSNTLLSYLPASITNLKQLNYLSLAYTKVTELPEDGWNKLNLHRLDLSGLSLKRIPKSLALNRYTHFSTTKEHGAICLYNTHLSEQNIEVFLQSPKLIKGLYSKDLIRINECKVIFLGDGDSGKSYTIKRIENEGKMESSNNTYVTKETPGVEISDYYSITNDNLCIHFWDFGGQELLHSMHRCFLTEKTCYVVTVKSRETKGSERAVYWLRNIQAFAPEAPVLLFINCWDNDTGERVIDEPKLRRDYPNIKSVIYCSAKNSDSNTFNDSVTSSIINMVQNSGYLDTKVNRKWNNVQLALQKKAAENNYLTKEEYHRICLENEIDNEQNTDLLTFFNNLGVCFSYHLDKDKNELAEYKLLDPKWLTNAVYAIIEEGMAYSTNGRISCDSVNQLLCKPVNDSSARRTVRSIQYTADECKYVIDVAVANDLCYRINKHELFFPALCHKDSPVKALDFQKDHPDSVEYRFKYSYLPDSIVHRLIICLLKEYTDINMEYCWLKGMIIRTSYGHTLLIRMDDDENLSILIHSNYNDTAKDIFSLIRREVLEINGFFNLKASESIIANSDNFSVVRLLKAIKRPIAIVDGTETGEEYDANDLLHQFYTNVDISRMCTDGLSILTKTDCFNKADSRDKRVIEAVFSAYSYTCQYCGKKLPSSKLQLDHIIPRDIARQLYTNHTLSKSYIKQLEGEGFILEEPEYLENYCPSCYPCNSKKGTAILPLSELRRLHENASKTVPDILKYVKARF